MTSHAPMTRLTLSPDFPLRQTWEEQLPGAESPAEARAVLARLWGEEAHKAWHWYARHGRHWDASLVRLALEEAGDTGRPRLLPSELADQPFVVGEAAQAVLESMRIGEYAPPSLRGVARYAAGEFDVPARLLRRLPCLAGHAVLRQLYRAFLRDPDIACIRAAVLLLPEPPREVLRAALQGSRAVAARLEIAGRLAEREERAEFLALWDQLLEENADGAEQLAERLSRERLGWIRPEQWSRMLERASPEPRLRALRLLARLWDAKEKRGREVDALPSSDVASPLP